MAQDTSPVNFFKRLSTLIEGYRGYRTSRDRIATVELFEAFLSERLKTILRIIEDRYSNLANEKKNLQLLIPLANIVKTLTDCFQYVSFEKSQRIYFLHEYRFPWETVEETLYKVDYTILQYISMLVDKISHFEQDSRNRFEDLTHVILMFHDRLGERKKFIHAVNEKLTPVNALIHTSLREIRERHITEETFRGIERAIAFFPDRINTYMDVFEGVHRYATYYVRLNENIPLIDFFNSARLFISKYKQYLEMLRQFLNRVRFETDEEKECEAFLLERLQKAPDFEKIIEALESTHLMAEKKQAVRKEKEHVIEMATQEYSRGLKFEKDLRLIEAIALYQKTIAIDKEYPEAVEGLERCKRKEKALPYFLKAQKKLSVGQREKAESLLLKALKKAPDFENARELLSRIEHEKKSEK